MIRYEGFLEPYLRLLVPYKGSLEPYLGLVIRYEGVPGTIFRASGTILEVMVTYEGYHMKGS